MTFNIQSHPDTHVAVVDNGKAFTYGELNRAIDTMAATLPAASTKRLYFIKTHNSFACLVQYLAVLRAGHCAMLLSASIADAALEALLSRYQPHGLLTERGLQTCFEEAFPIADSLALLMSTSGSSGAPKQVALSEANLTANAQSICTYLPIEPAHNTLANLPMHYAYGLSVINSHLMAGATLVFTSCTAVNREFWTLLEELPVHSMAGVPHSYEMLIRLGLTGKRLPDLRYVTQAGGKLKERWVRQLTEYCTAHGKRFYIMYGQTEATARMGWLAPEKLAIKPGAIGQAIPGGQFALKDHASNAFITSAHQTGELHYRGPNVMLGYTGSSDDLARFSPDEWLATGDLAAFDDDGDYYIVGRLKRIIKIHGQRISLDAAESQLSKLTDAELVCLGNDDQLTVLDSSRLSLNPKDIAQILHIHPSTVRVVAPAKLIFNQNGKLNYAALQERYCG